MRRQAKVSRRRPRGDGTRGALSSSAARSQSTGLNVKPSVVPSDWFVEIDGTLFVTTRASKLFARGVALILTLLVFSLCVCAMSMATTLLSNHFSMCSIASGFSPHTSETVQAAHVAGNETNIRQQLELSQQRLMDPSASSRGEDVN